MRFFVRTLNIASATAFQENNRHYRKRIRKLEAEKAKQQSTNSET